VADTKPARETAEDRMPERSVAEANTGRAHAALARISSSLKYEAMLWAQYACESVKPGVREEFKEGCVEALQRQFEIATFMVREGWYVPLPLNGDRKGFDANLQWATEQAMGAQQEEGV
jgi:spore coat protein CotF